MQFKLLNMERFSGGFDAPFEVKGDAKQSASKPRKTCKNSPKSTQKISEKEVQKFPKICPKLDQRAVKTGPKNQ